MTRKWSLERQWGVDMAVRGSTLPTNAEIEDPNKNRCKSYFLLDFCLDRLAQFHFPLFFSLRQMKWTRKIKNRRQKNPQQPNYMEFKFISSNDMTLNNAKAPDKGR